VVLTVALLTVPRAKIQDDLLGGFFRSVASTSVGMGVRTDSEAAFQEFLKRIPSTTNLAAAAGQMGEGQALLERNGTSCSLSTTPLPNSTRAGVSFQPADPDQSNPLMHSHSLGMQRIPSLDFLRQLMTQQQNTAIHPHPSAQLHQVSVKSEPPTISTLPQENSSKLLGLPGPSAVQYHPSLSLGLGLLPMGLPDLTGLNSNGLAMPLQLSQLGSATLATTTPAPPVSTLGHKNRTTSRKERERDRDATPPSSGGERGRSDKGDDKAEVRRARR
jgi:hypothetical protein